MANFETAFKKTMTAEGGYCNNPNDRGGETYRGIARNFHAKWQGWKIIDIYKEKFPDKFKTKLDKDCKLQDLVKDFYRNNFWNPISLDKCGSQKIANELFDVAVNCGVKTAIKQFQKTLSLPATGNVNDALINSMSKLK